MTSRTIPPHARRGTLHGQDLRRMVVALVAHDQAVVVIVPLREANDARVLSGSQHDVARRVGLIEEGAQGRSTRFVGAVFAPRDIEEERLRA